MTLIVFISSLFLPFNATHDSGLKSLDFMIGEWQFELKYRKPDGTYGTGEAISKVVYILDGKAIQDTYGETRNGVYVPFGNTIRSYDPVNKTFRMLWFNASLSDTTTFEGSWQGDMLVFKGKGRHGEVDILEKVTFFEIQKGQYSWNMDRSFDGGKTWIEHFFSYKATRIR